MKHFYNFLSKSVLLALFLCISVAAVAEKVSVTFVGYDGDPIPNYSFTIAETDETVVTNAEGVAEVDLVYEESYSVIPQYYDTPMGTITWNGIDIAVANMEDLCYYTFVLKDLDAAYYNEVYRITIGYGQDITPVWDRQGRFSLLLPSGGDAMVFASFTSRENHVNFDSSMNEILLDFDLAGKERVEYTVYDMDGQPFAGAVISVGYYLEPSEGDDDVASVQLFGGHTDEQGRVGFFLAPDQKYDITITHLSANEYYRADDIRTVEAGKVNEFSKSFDGAAVLAFKPEGVAFSEHGTIYLDYMSFVLASSETFRYITTVKEELSYRASFPDYIKEVEGAAVPELGKEKDVILDFSDQKKHVLVLDNYPEGVVSSWGSVVIATEDLYYKYSIDFNDLLPDAGTLSSPKSEGTEYAFYAPDGNYIVTMERTWFSTGDITYAVYPYRVKKALSGTDDCVLELPEMHQVKFGVSDPDMSLSSARIIVNENPTGDEFSVDEYGYFPNGTYSWVANYNEMSAPSIDPVPGTEVETQEYYGDPIFGASPRQFVVNGADQEVIWQVEETHKVTLSFSEIPFDGFYGSFSFTLTDKDGFVVAESGDLGVYEEGTFMELLVEAGTYTVTLKSYESNSYDYETIYLPDVKKEITVSDKDVNVDFSYAGYVPVSFDATFGGEKLTKYVGVVTDAQGQFVAEYDYEERYATVLLLPAGNYFVTMYSNSKKSPATPFTVEEDSKGLVVPVEMQESGNLVVVDVWDEYENTLYGASVTLEGYGTKTIEEGMEVVIFSDVEDVENLKLTVAKEGYVTIEQVISLSANNVEKDEFGYYVYVALRRILTSIESPTASKVLKVYPNPVRDVLNMELPESDGANWTLRLYNAVGNLVLSRTVVAGESVNVSSLASGVYFLQLSNGDEVLRAKVIKR